MSKLRSVILTILIVSGFSLSANAQIIKGRVLRAGGDTAVANAIVYYGGSMAGTIADEQGRFELPAKSQQIPITVSCIGYFSATVNYDADKQLIVYLKPKLTELKTVTITAHRADDRERLQNEKLFIQEFLGISEFAKSCTIVNLNEVNLYMDKKTLTLTADCNQPIVIKNKKLGYIINYYLDNFTRTLTSTHYLGNSIFKEDSTITGTGKAAVLNNRETVYTGSRMQFVRALWHNTLDKAGFTIKDEKGNQVELSQILGIDSLVQKYINIQKGIVIYHNSAISYKNTLTATKPYIFIDQRGYFGQGLEWSGRMSDQRVGDLLPLEYQSKNEPLESAAIVSTSPKPVSLAPFLLTAKPVADIKGVQKTGDTEIPLFFEKAYLHTDRNTYAQGEYMWFKAYVVNAQNNQSINYSKNLYVELIGPTAKIIQRKMLRLEGGLANGDFKLSDTLITGNYRLRAYTNWMRNFGDNFIFEKSIRLIGGLNAAQNVPVVTTSPKKKAVKVAPLPKVNPDTLPVVRFFPEGGAMVNGLSGVIAVKAEDSNGHGIAAKGSIVDNAGETITRFVCDSLGFGAFTLIADVAQHYQAVVGIRGAQHHFVLPQVADTGFSMHIQDKQAAQVITFACNDATFAKTNGQHIYLTAKYGGKTYARQSIFFKDQSQLVKLDNNLLAEGINCITLTDEKAQPLTERLVYVHHALNTSLSISADKPVYQPRQPVSINFKLNKPGVAHLSLAAVDALTVPVQAENIVSYLQLQSEVRGTIEQAAKYFDTTNVNRFKQMDLLLLTQGWRGFVWKHIQDTTLEFKNEVEQGITITGRVRKVGSYKPVANMLIDLHAPKAQGDKFFETHTDSAGRFAIYGPVFYGYQYLNILSRNFDAKSKGKSNSGGLIMVDSLYRDILPVHTVNNFINDTLPSTQELLTKLKIPKKQQLKEVKIVSNVYKFAPEIHPITLADQKDYGTVGQYLIYTIPGAHNAYTPDGNRFLRDANMVYLDVPIKGFHPLEDIGLIIGVSSTYSDGSRIDRDEAKGQSPLDLSIKDAISITVTKFVNIKGYLTYRVNVALRPGAFRMKDYFDNTTADMVGYYKAREFYKPKFGEIDDKPDPRYNTIHWEPNITTNSAGEAVISFFNTPNKGNYRIIAQGVSESGVPVMATAAYQVK